MQSTIANLPLPCAFKPAPLCYHVQVALMENRKPLLNYILINIAVSALTTLLVLVIWNRLTALPEPKSTSSIPTTSPAPESVSAAQASNFSDQLKITTIVGTGDNGNEHVLIDHIGTEDVLLAEWTLRDEDGNRYTFPALILHSGASVEVFSRQGEDSVTRLFWNQDDPIWSISETATLQDPTGEVQASYKIP